MNVYDIVWPEDANAANVLYLRFAIQIVDSLGIVFPHAMANPRIVAQRYIDGEISVEEYDAEAVAWWAYLDTVGGIREFRRRDALLARLAICLVGIKAAEALRLADTLSWLLEILGLLDLDTSGAFELMSSHFYSRKSAEKKLS